LARVLIVGCGCRGRALAAALSDDGHAVRGTTRDEAGLLEIEAAGVEPAKADPDRLATLLPHIAGVSVICWLMGGADTFEVNEARLEALVRKLVDTPVRGLVYEARGAAPRAALERGSAIVAAAAETYRIPVEVVDADPADHDAWLVAVHAAVDRLLTD
jgi:uncharacterized protein YbjT (DUF2867 family)